MYRSGPSSPREQFLDQFEMDGSGWLYRYRETGAAYRVTDAEKEVFVAAFQRRRRRITWVALAIYAPILFWAFAVPLFRSGQGEPPSYWIWVMWFSLLGLQHLNDLIGLRAPLQTLRLRRPVAPALPKAERQRMTIERQPLALIVGAATLSFLLLLYFAVERPSIGWRSLVLIVASVAALAWAIIQGIRKYRLAHADQVASSLT